MDWLLDILLGFYGPPLYGVIFGILLLCGFGLPIPEDITLFVAGFLAYLSLTEFWPTLWVCVVGVMAGDSIIFLLGAKVGRKLAQKWLFKRVLTEERLAAAAEQFRGKGARRLLFAARFMPGLRTPVYFSAGMLHVPFLKFFIYDGLAMLISVPLIVGTAYYFGDQWSAAIAWVRKLEHGILYVILALVAVGVFKWWRSQHRQRSSSDLA